MMQIVSTNGTGFGSSNAQAYTGSVGPCGDRKDKCYEKTQHSTMEITSGAREAPGVAFARDAECPEIEDSTGAGTAGRRPHPPDSLANRRLQLA